MYIKAKIILILLVIGMVCTVCNTNSRKGNLLAEIGDNYNAEVVSIDSADDYFIAEEELNDFGLDNDGERYALWYKEYFTNEWGEEMPEHPFISNMISGSFNLNIVYSHEMGFRFHLTNDYGDDRLVHICSPVSMLFRNSDGGTYEVEPDNVDNYMVYVTNSDNVRFIAQMFNSGKFDILMRYELWLEPHSSKWTYHDVPGTFSEAVEKLLPYN